MSNPPAAQDARIVSYRGPGWGGRRIATWKPYWAWGRGVWRRVRVAAGLASVRFKDLRDTYASQLLTAGVPIQYLSRQLGHAGIAVTQAHYARWLGDDFRDPLRRRAGEVPADFLARLPSVRDDLLQ